MPVDNPDLTSLNCFLWFLTQFDREESWKFDGTLQWPFVKWKTSSDWNLSCHCALCESQINPESVRISSLSSLKVECKPFSFLFRWCRCFRTHWDSFGLQGYACGTKQWPLASRNRMSSWKRSFHVFAARLRDFLFIFGEFFFGDFLFGEFDGEEGGDTPLDVATLGRMHWIRPSFSKLMLSIWWGLLYSSGFWSPFPRGRMWLERVLWTLLLAFMVCTWYNQSASLWNMVAFIARTVLWEHGICDSDDVFILFGQAVRDDNNRKIRVCDPSLREAI